MSGGTDEKTRLATSDERIAATRASWNAATRIHNAHKRDQAAFLKAGGSTLFPEEVELTGDVRGRTFLHMLCNAGQDSLSFAARGAVVTGVDLSDEAIAFAQGLSKDSGIAATFVRQEGVAFLESDGPAYDVVFASYGALAWIEDLPRFFRGVRARLSAGGICVVVEFHPLVWSFDKDWQRADPYFAPGRVFDEPVGDYVLQSGKALAPSGFVDAALPPNTLPACSHQHTVADTLQATVDAGLALQVVREWPYANGCRIHAGMVDVGQGRFAAEPPWNLPLMLGLRAGVAAPPATR